MISRAEIQKRIVHRAYAQFNRDIKQIAILIQNAGGSISIYDVMDKVQAGEKEHLKYLKLSKIPILSKFIKPQDKDPDEYQVYDFLLRFMADLEAYDLTMETLQELNLREMYYKKYKKEYEEHQVFLFNTKDMRLYNNTRLLIRGGGHEEDSAESF